MIKIRFVVAFPLDAEQIAARETELATRYSAPDVRVDVVGVRRGTVAADSYYELSLLDAYMTEAAVDSVDLGYDAVVLDTVTDSGMDALRSRLSIPIIGPGLVQQHVAATLGKRFSIISMWKRWHCIYDKTLTAYGTGPMCASVRYIGEHPASLADANRQQEIIDAIVEEGVRAVAEDGAEVLLPGSTTMWRAVEPMRAATDVPVIDPAPLALGYAELLVRLGLSHSPRAYEPPGEPADWKFHDMVIS